MLESGIADVQERILLRAQPGELGTDLEGLVQRMNDRFDHQAKMAAFEGPVKVLHTLGDDLVPVRHARQIAQWAGAGAEENLSAAPRFTGSV